MVKKDWSSFKLLSHEDKKLICHLNEVKKNSISLLTNINKYSDFDKIGEIKKLVKLIAISHDFGKCSEFFQNRLLGRKCRDDKLERHGLISALFGLFLLEEFKYSSFKEGFPESTVFRVIRRHHGDLENFETNFVYENSSKSTYKEILEIFNSIKKNKEEVNKIYNHFLDYILKFEDFLKKLGDKKGPTGKIPIKNATIFKIMNNKTIYFYYFNLIYSILIESDKKSASKTEEIVNNFNPSEDFLIKYKEKFDLTNNFNKIREEVYQETIENLDKYLLEGKKRFFEIDAPTGSGKTLTMLGCAFRIRNFLKSNNNLEPKIIYSLPFISIIEQNYKVFKDVIENIKGEIGNDILLEHHHLADEIFRTTVKKEIGYNKSSFLIENWHSEIIVTTFFQLFKSIFTNKNHLLKKYNKLTNSIILIDEIQSVPPGLLSLIRDCIKILTEEFGSYLILATATKPILNKDDEISKKKINSTRLFDQNKSDRINEEVMNKYFNRYRISAGLLEDRITLNELDKILEEAYSLTNFMVVLNTIDCTKEIYSRLKEKLIFNDYEIIYLSTNIPPNIRFKRLEKVSDYIRK
ncbi:MAG: CRISPR-associated endonuclease Cas3'', partial [Candidatus Thermoplasmatota archaeon]